MGKKEKDWKKKWVWISNTRIEFDNVLDRDAFLANLNASGQLSQTVLKQVFQNGSHQTEGPLPVGKHKSVIRSTFVLKEQS